MCRDKKKQTTTEDLAVPWMCLLSAESTGFKSSTVKMNDVSQF